MDDDRPQPAQPPASAQQPWAVVVSHVPVLPTAPPRRPLRFVGVAVTLLLVAGVTTVLTRAALDSGRAALVEATSTRDVDFRAGPPMGTPEAPYSFTWLDASGRPVRWNPCREIRYVVNPEGGPADGLATVQEAARRLSVATGLRLVYEGPTAETPSTDRPLVQEARYGKRFAPMLIAWAPLRAIGLTVSGDTVGVATPSAAGDGESGVILSAQVAFDSARKLDPGFGSKGAWGAVAMHELAHAVGLSHVQHPGQLMDDAPRPGPGPAQWGAGDLAGLRLLGRTAGCVEEPGIDEVDQT